MHKNIRLLTWFNFTGSFLLYGPIMILYFSRVSGSYALGMSIFSVTNLASSALEVPTGVLSDRVGRKYTLVAGSAALVAAVICYAIGGTYAALLVGALFEGLARAFFSGNNDALLYDTLAESGQADEYQEYLGKIGSTYHVALAISAILGGLISAVSFELAFWLTVVPQVIGLVIALQLVEPQVHSRDTSLSIYSHLREAFVKIVSNARLRNLTAAGVVNWAVGESAWLFRSTFISTVWPTWALGLAQLLPNIGASLSFYFAGRIIKRWGEFRILLADVLSTRLIIAFSLLVPSALSPLLMSITSLLYGASQVAANGLAQREFSPEQRATMASMTTFAGSLAFAGFSLVLGALADSIGIVPALLVAQVLGVSSTYFYWRAFRLKSVEIET